MKHAHLSDLKTVSEAIFQKEYQNLQPLLMAEARIVQQLAQLDAQVTQVSTDAASSSGYRVSGTDMLWHRWEAATRSQLNMELARLRAQKLAAMDNLRLAFGRTQAVASLSRKMQSKTRHHTG